MTASTRYLTPAIAWIAVAPLVASEPPNPLAAADGTLATSAEAWRKDVRPATLELFRHHVYGNRPVGKPDDFKATVLATDAQALAGKATSKEIEFTFKGPLGAWKFKAALFIPNEAKGPAPTWVSINFDPPDPSHPINAGGRWPVKEIIERGYATVAFHFKDLDPDRKGAFDAGVRAIISEPPPAADGWGALSAWSWGASRVMDYLETDDSIDSKKVAIVGHSRAGKAALWGGAEDERFAMVISNNSGCSGAALTRGKQGERIANITENFPYWFCENYRQFANREDSLPVDQHQLLGLIAPRLLYVASATDDQWADPAAEFKACQLVEPVYALFGKKALESPTMPPADQALLKGHVGYHVRTGKHDLKSQDWQHFMDFADLHWGKPRSR
jgi:hypothetical protein